MKIFTEILKATPINFIVSYFSFIVQTNSTCTYQRDISIQHKHICITIYTYIYIDMYTYIHITYTYTHTYNNYYLIKLY